MVLDWSILFMYCCLCAVLVQGCSAISSVFFACGAALLQDPSVEQREAHVTFTVTDAVHVLLCRCFMNE